jgi:probable phosphoglycerate mutase
VTVIKFDLHGPLLRELGNRSYMSEDLRSRPGT